MFKQFKLNTATNRLIEEKLYEQALNEFESGQIRGGLWAKALANASGDEQKARGLYLKFHVQAMLDEAEIAKGFAESLQEELLKQKRSAASNRKEEAQSKNNIHINNEYKAEKKSIYKDVLKTEFRYPASSKTNKKYTQQSSDPIHISNFLPLEEFSKFKSLPEEKLIKMIRDGFYQGRLFNDSWYVHYSEFNS